jgi:hypothetical protein
MEQLTEIQEQILNGHLLGDGFLNRETINNNARFIIAHKSTDKNYLLWTAKHFENFIYKTGLSASSQFDTRTHKTYYQNRISTKADPIFTEYHNQWYPEGKKIVPIDLILTPQIISVWFCDDGNVRYDNIRKNSALKFATDGFSEKDVIFLADQLQNMYGNKIAMKPKGDKFVITCTTASAINTILNDIYPVFPPLKRKFDQIINNPLVSLPQILDDSPPEQINFYEKPFEYKPPCIYCQSENIVKRRPDNGKQLYSCKECGKYFKDIKDYIVIPKLARK